VVTVATMPVVEVGLAAEGQVHESPLASQGVEARDGGVQVGQRAFGERAVPVVEAEAAPCRPPRGDAGYSVFP